MSSARMILLSVLWIGACSRSSDPCGRGMRLDREADRCVAVDDGRSTVGPGVDAGERVTPPSSQGRRPDAGSGAGAASMDAGMASLDAGREVRDAGTPTKDAGVVDPDAGDASMPPAPMCSENDIATWRAFHLSEALLQTIGQCASDPACRKGMCALDKCMREATGVTTCESCVRDEVNCVATSCTKACGASSTDEACRACACAKGCIAKFDACSGEPLDVCADCNATTCSNMSVLPPELIMVVVDSILAGG